MLSKFNLLNSVLITLLLLLVSVTNASAETTFFDQDDAFVMGNSVTGGVIVGTSEGGCIYRWNCTNWSECLESENQIRNCTNIGTCSDAYNSPETEQNCTYTAPEKIVVTKGTEITCRNGICDSNENCSTCRNDCGACLAASPVLSRELVITPLQGGIFAIAVLGTIGLSIYFSKKFSRASKFKRRR